MIPIQRIITGTIGRQNHSRLHRRLSWPDRVEETIHIAYPSLRKTGVHPSYFIPRMYMNWISLRMDFCYLTTKPIVTTTHLCIEL